MSKKYPTAQDVGARIFITVYNAGPGVTMNVTDQKLLELGDRVRLHPSFRDGVISYLPSLECEAKRTSGGTAVRIPSESVYLSFDEAAELSREAQETGMRSTPAYYDTSVQG